MKLTVIYHGHCADVFGAAWGFHFRDAQDYDFHRGVCQL